MKRCQCVDPDCRVHAGASRCSKEVFVVLFRIDMEDQTGTPMCEPCSEDALESGLFVTD